MPNFHEGIVGHVASTLNTMARRKTAASNETTADDVKPLTTTPGENGATSAPAVIAVDVKLEPVKVNNASIAELKIACDDAVKRVRLLLAHL